MISTNSEDLDSEVGEFHDFELNMEELDLWRWWWIVQERDGLTPNEAIKWVCENFRDKNKNNYTEHRIKQIVALAKASLGNYEMEREGLSHEEFQWRLLYG